MKTISRQLQRVDIVRKIVCDICGKSYSYQRTQDFFEINEFLSIDFVGGYGSVFGDNNRVRCDICQTCLYKMIADFAQIDPIG